MTGKGQARGESVTLQTTSHPNGSFRFLPAISAYSAGFAVSDGYEITALRLLDCPTLAIGFERIDEEIKRRGLAPAALAGLQLRSPGAFGFEEFAQFNDEYCQLLIERDLIIDGVNPVSRTNVIPVHNGPAVPTIAVAFLVNPTLGRGGSDFVVAGAGEVNGDLGPENIVARGDLSQKGLALKVDCVLEIMLERLRALGASGDSPTTVNVYTAHEILGLPGMIEMKLPTISTNGYATWLTRPPVKEIEYEMDCASFTHWTVI
jgi:hypothetical protein